MKQIENAWTTTITPKKASGFDIDMAGLYRSRDLILLFVRRDFVTFYKQTILGPLWFFIQPLLTTVVFTVVFGRIARIPTEGVPPFLFYMSGIIIWGYFASCLDKTSKTFSENQGIFGKVYFPRLSIPISIVITNLFSFGIQFVTFVIFFIYFASSSSELAISWWSILSTPLLLLQVGALGAGVGLIISAMTVRYRDLAFVVGFGVQLWMYATPIVYPMSEVPDKWKPLIAMNPMAGIIEVFRYSFFGSGEISFYRLVLSVFSTVLIFMTGIYVFSRAEKNFIDTV